MLYHSVFRSRSENTVKEIILLNYCAVQITLRRDKNQATDKAFSCGIIWVYTRATLRHLMAQLFQQKM